MLYSLVKKQANMTDYAPFYVFVFEVINKQRAKQSTICRELKNFSDMANNLSQKFDSKPKICHRIKHVR